MKAQIECKHCGKKHQTSMVNVYVIKRRFCPTCKFPLNIKGETLVCPKCGKVTEMKDTNAINALPVSVVDATLSFEKRDAYVAKGYQVEKKIEPEKQLCTRCINTRTHIENVLEQEDIIKKEQMKEIKALSDIDFYEQFYSQVQPMLRQIMFQRAVDKGVIKLSPKGKSMLPDIPIPKSVVLGSKLKSKPHKHVPVNIEGKKIKS